MFSDDDLLPVSALQHLLFCERQCALIHVERVWAENRWTAEGRVMHERVHAEGAETRGQVHVARGLALRSLRLGLAGVADVVEFVCGAEGEAGCALPGRPGRWRPFPVEFKRGKPKPDGTDKVQLCAQGLCLEEMLQTPVTGGALFYGATRRRLEVPLDAELRGLTEETAQRLHELVSAERTPPAKPSPKCERCSLANLCQPGLAQRAPVGRYLARMLAEEGAG